MEFGDVVGRTIDNGAVIMQVWRRAWLERCAFGKCILLFDDTSEQK